MNNEYLTKKNIFPFRVGCPSFVYSADILPNVKLLAPLVDDVEIILFESDSRSKYPDKQVIEELRLIAKTHNITYTIHLPIDKNAGSSNHIEQQSLLGEIEYIINLVKPLNPYGYILHLQGIDFSSDKKAQNIWSRACYEFCKKLVLIPNINPKLICIENYNYPIKWHLEFVNHFGFSICLDVGHMWLYNQNWYEIIKNNISNTRVLHIHGVCDGKDHYSMKYSKIEDVEKMMMVLKNEFKGVCTVEVFNKGKLFESLRVIGAKSQLI